MNKKFLYELAIILGFILCGFILLFSNLYVVSIDSVPMSVVVKDNIGFNLNPGVLHFGVMIPGSVSERSVFISHKSFTSLEVSIKTYDNMSDWVIPSDNHFILKKNESVKVGFNLNLPSDAQYGTYNGTVKVVYTRSFKALWSMI